MSEQLKLEEPAPQTDDYQGFADLEEAILPGTQDYEGFGFDDAPETPKDEGFGFEPTLAETFDTLDNKEKAKRSILNKIGRKVTSLFITPPKSSVGDMSHALHDQGTLSDYRKGLDTLTDGGFDKTGKFDASREDILGRLQDEANAENSLIDHAQPIKDVQEKIANASSDSEAAQLAEEAVGSFKDTEMSKLANTIQTEGSTSDKALLSEWLSSEASYESVTADQIRDKREEILKRTLQDAQSRTLSAAQTAATRQRYQ